MIQSVSWKYLVRNGKTGIIHEQPHLDNRLIPVLLTDAHFSDAFFKNGAIFVQNVVIRVFNFKIEVRNIIEYTYVPVYYTTTAKKARFFPCNS